MKLNKESLVKRIANNMPTDVKTHDINAVVTDFFENISDSLTNGERIEIRGFGSMSLRNRRVSHDPRSNNSENTNKINCRSVYFRMAKDLIDKLNKK